MSKPLSPPIQRFYASSPIHRKSEHAKEHKIPYLEKMSGALDLPRMLFAPTIFKV